MGEEEKEVVQEDKPLTLEDAQVKALQKRLQAEVDAHNQACSEKENLEIAVVQKKQEIDRRFGKVLGLQELLQEAEDAAFQESEQGPAANGETPKEKAVEAVVDAIAKKEDAEV